jgi:hypothetical protein
MSAQHDESQPNWRTWYLVLGAFLLSIILFFIGFSALFS